MIRKQIYLTPQIDRELSILARKEGKSVAQILREILEESLRIKTEKEAPGAVLLEMAANAAKGPKDLSTNLFSYLYGDKSSRYGKGKKTITLTKAEEKRLARFLNGKL